MKQCYPPSQASRTSIPFKVFGLFIFAFITAQPLLAQPVISSFTPTSGNIGTKVTISCSGLGTATADTIVYFGAVKAPISAASPTSLTVSVPTGTTYQPITITKNGLTAFSTLPFIVTFPGAFPVFSDTSFAPRIDQAVTYPLIGVCLADFDRDGKPDLATTEGSNVNGTNGGLHVFQNTGKPGKISFGAPVWYTVGGTNLVPGILATDVDGDGLLDIVIADNGHHKITVYRNTSSGGIISFDSPVLTDVASPLFYIASGDLNGDGKPDIVGGQGYGSLCVLKNTSTPGLISFTTSTISNIMLSPQFIAIRDMDGDSKPDIVVGLSPALAKPDMFAGFSVLINTSSGGNISFTDDTQPAANITGGYTNGIELSDLDGDGKYDVILSDLNGTNVYVFRNTSTPGNLSMTPGTAFPSGSIGTVAATDLDGDGKPDLAVSSSTGLSILKNQSTPGTISFAAPAGLLTPGNSPSNCIGDIDGDGKPDLIVANSANSTLSFLRNKIGESLISPSGANPVTGDVIKTVTVDASVQQSNGITYVQRHYDIEPVNNPATATAHIKLYFTQPDFDNFNTFPGHGADLPTGPADNAGKANLRIYQNHGFSTTSTPGSYSGSTVVIDPPDGYINWNAGTQLWEVDFDVTGFSGFFISSLATSLPLKLLSFTATEQASNVLLKWSTTGEVNTSYFEAQRSTDGSQFAPVTTIKAAGNSSTVLSYQYVDTPGPRPVYYYRLKMTDIDGSSTYSDIVQITLASRRSPLRIYPNPARNYITVETPAAAKASIRLLDVSGKLLQKTDLPKNSIQTRLSIQGLAPGSYKIIWSDGTKTLTQSLLIL